MTQKQYFFSLILISILCTQCKSVDYVEIPFKTSKVGHIIVPLKVNGVDINAIFDTGSQGSSISNSDFINTGLKLQPDSLLCEFPFLHKGKEFTLPVTKPKKIGIGNIRSKEKFEFTVQPDSINISLCGNDVIDQFCWLFDFNSMNVKVSEKSFIIDTTLWIPLPYKERNHLKFCTIHSKNSVINDIFMDTGGGAVLYNGKYHVIFLTLTKKSTNGDTLTIRGKHTVEKKSSAISVSDILYDNYFPIYKNKMGLPAYSGFVGLIDRKMNSFYDDTKTNGTIKIGYAKGLYSGLYLDTHKKILYLKP